MKTLNVGLVAWGRGPIQAHAGRPSVIQHDLLLSRRIGLSRFMTFILSKTLFINDKKTLVMRPPTIDGMDVDEFISRNADLIWLRQNEMREYMSDDEDTQEN